MSVLVICQRKTKMSDKQKINFFYFFPLILLRFGETIIATAKNKAEIITIEAPIGKSVTKDR